MAKITRRPQAKSKPQSPKRGKNSSVRAAAKSVPALVKALQEKDADLQLNAAIALGKIGKDGVAPVAVEPLKLPPKDASAPPSK